MRSAWKKKKAERQRKSRMLRFEKACQLPNQQLAKQPIIEAHLSYMPRALLLKLASLKDVLFTQLHFPDGSDQSEYGSCS